MRTDRALCLQPGSQLSTFIVPAIVVIATMAGCNRATTPSAEYWRFQPTPLDTTVTLESSQPNPPATIADAPLFEPAQAMSLEPTLREPAPLAAGSDIPLGVQISFANASDSRFINELTAPIPILTEPQLVIRPFDHPTSRLTVHFDAGTLQRVDRNFQLLGGPIEELRIPDQALMPGQFYVPEPNSVSMAAVMMTYILLRRRHDYP